MTPNDLYSEWLEKFINNGIPFEMDVLLNTSSPLNHIISINSFTYKFIFNIDINNSGEIDYRLKYKNYQLFANLFFIDGWEDELKYQLIYYQYRDKNTKPNPNFGDNYGEINYYVKSWVNYVTFQDSRVIVQFRLDKYERKEKLKKIQYDQIQNW
jgi:hypothetical protein